MKKGSENLEVEDHQSEEIQWFLDDVKTVLPLETARQEVLLWLRGKNISNRKRKERASWLENLVEGFMSGDLTLDPETFELTVKLRVPIKGTSELKFGARRHVSEFERMYRSNDIDAHEGTRRIIAATALLTDKTIAEIGMLQQDDYDMVGSIALFFM